MKALSRSLKNANISAGVLGLLWTLRFWTWKRRYGPELRSSKHNFWFSAMRNEEVFITSFLEGRVELRTMFITCSLQGRMKMDRKASNQIYHLTVLTTLVRFGGFRSCHLEITIIGVDEDFVDEWPSLNLQQKMQDARLPFWELFLLALGLWGQDVRLIEPYLTTYSTPRKIAWWSHPLSVPWCLYFK